MASEETPQPPPQQPVLEAEDVVDHGESVIGTESGSSSYLSSLKSSIYSYRYENGRRYHAFREGTYPVPNDDEEQSRMDLVHHIYSLLLDGKLYMAPISKNPSRVLDLGTGTGIWAVDFADEHPSAEVVGTDLSPIQPDWVPPNCIFEVDDYEDDWVYKTPFDLIHMRELEGCIANDEALFKKALDNLVPGGYLEIQAMRGQFLSDDGTAEKATGAQQWAVALRSSSEAFGKPLETVPEWKSKLIAAGFEDVHEEIHKIPVGAWPKDPKLKEVGKFQLVQCTQAIEAYALVLFDKVLGMPKEESQVLIAKAKKELADPSIHIYMPVHLIWGKKPGGKE